MPFDRLLIANRGEIACRIARTARRMGIRTIAVYSDADADALHVRTCDEAWAIGGLTAAESYLRIDAIIDAARRSGAAGHSSRLWVPVGEPPAGRALRAAKAWCSSDRRRGHARHGLEVRRQGVAGAAPELRSPPDTTARIRMPALLRREADRIGYPLLIKASNGGGGRGIRRVDGDADFDAALVSCKREAAASFGDDHVLIEKYVQRPRHIEFQIFADTPGHVRASVRTGLLGAAPSSEGARGGAGSRDDAATARGHGRGGGERGARPSATSAPARSNSSSRPMARTTSWK